MVINNPQHTECSNLTEAKMRLSHLFVLDK